MMFTWNCDCVVIHHPSREELRTTGNDNMNRTTQNGGGQKDIARVT